MERRAAVFDAIRQALCNSATVAAMVATSAITVSKRHAKSTYPAIRMRVVGGTGINLDSFLHGDVYLNIYTTNDNSAAHLASIYSVVRDKISDNEANLTTSNIGIGLIREEFVDYPLYEEQAQIYYLAARFSFVAQAK